MRAEVRGGRWAWLLKRAFADRLVLVTAFLVVLFAATLVAAIPIYVNAVAQSGLRERLAHAPVTDANLEASLFVSGGNRDRALDRRVTAITEDVFRAAAVPVSLYRSGESEPFRTDDRTVVFGFFDGIPRHARLTAGRWPGSSRAPVQVAVSSSAARELHLRVGDRLRLRSRVDQNRVVTVGVVGLYRVERPTSVYWWREPLATTGTDGSEYGPLVTTRRSFFALAHNDVELRWRFDPDFRRLAIGQAADLRRRLTLLPRRINEGRSSGQQIEIDTKLPAILADAAQSLHLARAGVLVPSIQLGLLAVYGLLFTTSLLVERRRSVTESLRLRGATSGQIVTMALLEASLIALPAVAIAPWLAATSLRALNHVGPLTTVGLRLDPQVGWAAYALAAGAGAVCVAGLALPALWAGRSTIARERRRRPLTGLVQRARLDLVLVALALLGYWQLRRYHGVLLAHGGGLGIDPFLVVAPALLLLAGALLSLRLVPIAAALVERVVPSMRGVVAPLGFWQLARRPHGYARSVLLLVLAIAIGVFATVYSRTWHTSQLDQARFSAGSDLLVVPSDAGGAPPAIDLASSYRAIGVENALPTATDTFNLTSSGEESGNLLALDARRAATVVHPRSDFASRPLAELLRPLAENRSSLASLALPGRPTQLALSLQLTLSPRSAVGGTSVFLGPTQRDRASPFLYLRDGAGVLYLYRLGDLAPGRSRLYTLDLSQVLPRGPLARPQYPLSVTGLEFDLDAPYLVPRQATLTVRSLDVAGVAGGPWQRVRLSRRWHALPVGFKYAYQSPRVDRVSAVGRSMSATVTTGSSLSSPRPQIAEFLLRPGRDSLRRPLPVLVSDRFLAATDARVGQVVRLALSRVSVTARIVGAFHRFPTLDPATPAVVADLPTYLAFSFATSGDVVQPSGWWLRTDRERPIAEELRGAPFSSVDVVSRRERERALLEDPVPLGVIGALTLGFVGAAVLAAVGFAASTAAAARTRMLEFAVLRSLGLQTSQLSRWISLESALVVVLSLLGGMALGLLVSWLVLPYVALGTSGAAPVPPVRLGVPWTTVLYVELVLLGALLSIAAVQIELVRRLRLAPVLRGGEGAPAT